MALSGKVHQEVQGLEYVSVWDVVPRSLGVVLASKGAEVVEVVGAGATGLHSSEAWPPDSGADSVEEDPTVRVRRPTQASHSCVTFMLHG